MSFRSNHTVQTRIENKRFSYRQVRRKSQKQISYQSQSSSQPSLEKQQHNFNSGHNLKNIQVSSSSKSQSSQNETESFIRAQFKPSLINKIDDFKLFSKQIQNPRQQKESLSNPYKKDNQKRKQTYDTAYFQISLEDEPVDQKRKSHKISSRKYLPLQIPQIHITQIQSSQRQKQSKSQFFQELEFIQKTIMKTLKQKQKHIQILVNQVEHLNEQKMHNFKINRQLQQQLLDLRKRSNQNIVQNHNWRPKNVEEMRLQIQNQKLSQELKKLQDQQFNLNENERQLKEQEKVLKESLKSTLKTRKQYAKCLVRSGNQPQKQKSTKQKNNTNQANSRKNPLNLQKSMKQQRTQSKKQNKHTINYLPKQSESKLEPVQNQLNQLQQKQLLIKLLNDFNHLKAKVDQSLIQNKKQNSINARNISNSKKKKRTVINLKK